MKTVITNMPSFLRQVKGAVAKKQIQILDNFQGQAKGHLSGQTGAFRGSKEGSIAEPSSIVYTLRTKDKVLTINPNPVSLEVFRSNATPQSGGVLFQAEAPDWFDYHGIPSESVHIRPTGMMGQGSRVPLGNDERKFFGNTFSYLVRNAQMIIKDKF